MRNKNNKHLGLEISPDLHFKLHYIAKYEDRSANGPPLHLSLSCQRSAVPDLLDRALAHRLVLSTESRMKGVTAQSVVMKVLKAVPVPVKL